MPALRPKADIGLTRNANACDAVPQTFRARSRKRIKGG